MVALALATVVWPASAVITIDPNPAPLGITKFDPNFWRWDNTPLSISERAWASALFVGQGWDYTAKAVGEAAPWEFSLGLPTASTDLALMGQYPPTVPPPGLPPVDNTLLQNVVSFDPGAPLLDRFGGMIDNYYNGVTSILFRDDVNTFVTDILDAGINIGDDFGGPLHFAFYGRKGNFLQQFDLTKAVTGSIHFNSTAIDIAGVQIWHEDPRGLEFRKLQFGIVSTPIPATLGLVLFGLAALGRQSKRRSSSGHDAEHDSAAPGRQASR
jgi:hypothetical protein